MLTAWAAGKFDAERIAKAVKAFEVPDKISHRQIIIPGLCSQHLRRPRRGAAGLADHGRAARGHRYPVVPQATGQGLMAQEEPTPREAGEDRPCVVRLDPAGVTVTVPAGTLLEEAISQAGLSVPLPCGGQGRCGRCVVHVREGEVRRRSALRLSEDDIARGYALACQTLVGSDVTVWLPPREELVERADARRRRREDGPGCGPLRTRRRSLGGSLRVDRRAPLDGGQHPRSRAGAEGTGATARTARGQAYARRSGCACRPRLRDGEWTVTAEVEQGDWTAPSGPYRLLDVLARQGRDQSRWVWPLTSGRRAWPPTWGICAPAS